MPHGSVSCRPGWWSFIASIGRVFSVTSSDLLDILDRLKQVLRHLIFSFFFKSVKSKYDFR